MCEKLEKITRVRLPFDLRHEDPNKNYGIHGTDIWFVLKGEKGAVQYGVTLPCYLPHIEINSSYMRKINGFDVGYHSYTPMYEGQSPMDCDVLGCECYYDGSALKADEWTKIIFSTIGRRPEEVLWKLLEQEYKSRFNSATE